MAYTDKMKEKINFPEIWGLGLGIFLLVYSGFLQIFSPKEPYSETHSGFRSPIIALEMSETPKHVQDIIGTQETEEFPKLTSQYRTLNYFDFGFIFCYMAFFAYTGHYAGRRVRSIFLKIFLVMVAVLVVGGFCDLVENILILNLLDSKNAEEMLPSLEYLKSTSQLKWFCLYLYVAVVGIYFWLYEKGLLLRIASVFLVTSFFLGLFSFLKVFLLEIGFVFLVIGMILVWLQYGFTLAFSSLSKKT
ncbi:putative membrane protein [Leptospira ryugenii]|uniref:Putative membrane protein n=2 Tax=Leptospira ryugenii TaxID=1917863 RepID=A0A2P2DVS9_9LEPT|nr:putative membrane protein [Leptospira ryugenii]